MLVVLVVLVLLTSLSPLLLDRVVPNLRFEAAARELASTLRLARGFAIRDNRARVVVIDVGARIAAIGGARTRSTLPDGVRIDLVVAAIERVDAATGRIRFFPDGSSTGGKIVLTSGQRALAVVVDWFSGQVRLEDGTIS